MRASHMRVGLGCWLALCVAPMRAAPCPKTGEEPPAVRTLIASKDSPETEAWIVAPDCNVTVHTTWTRMGPDDVRLWLTYDKTPGLERIQSVPSSVRILVVRDLDLSCGVNLTSGKSLQSVELFNCSLASLAGVILPDTLTELRLTSNKLTTVNATLPSQLKDLNLNDNSLAALDFSMPRMLESLAMGANPITKLEGITFSNTTTTLIFAGTQITVVRGCKFPPALQYLGLPSSENTSLQLHDSGENTMNVPASSVQTSIELRETDFQTLTNSNGTAFVANTVSVCDDKTARLATLRTGKICVISDARFDVIYGAQQGSKSNGSDLSSIVSSNSTGSPSVDRSASSVSKSHTTVIVVSTIVGLVVLVLSIVGLRLCLKRGGLTKKSGKDASGDHVFMTMSDGSNTKEAAAESTLMGSSLRSDGSREIFANDVRHDKILECFRLDEREVELLNLISQGGNGVVYRGGYNGLAVAVKRMLPGLWRDDTALGRFMDEIRLCATLMHPNIVKFIGVTWTSLKDLSVVTEYMGGGDLHDLLYKHSSPSPDSWSQPWTSSQGVEMKPKTLVAQDIVEAIAYLHAFATPVLHRDLKARNVLLSTDGNAKLSDFGISRELVVDKTMTREVGTSAWIAPEVLRGERYGEKADIYSLGVLLVEMDRCGHPYGSRDMQSYHVLVLVSTSELRPEVSSSCPSGIRSLVDRCVSFDASARPTIAQVLASLHVM